MSASLPHAVPYSSRPRPIHGWDLPIRNPDDARLPRWYLILPTCLEGKMGDSFRSSVVCLLVTACLLVPVAVCAADSSATTTADPTNAAASAATTNSGANVGAAAVINPTLVDLLVKKGILTTAEAHSLRNMSGSA